MVFYYICHGKINIWIYHDWIIADSELPPAPPGYDPAWLQDDDDLPF